MKADKTVPIGTPCGTKESLLPGILAAVAMVAFSIIQVMGMMFYQYGSAVIFMLVIGAFVYFGTKGYQQWKAACA